MRLRRGKGGGDDARAAPPPSADARVEEPTKVLPPDAATRVDDPAPPSAGDRVDEPAKVLPPERGADLGAVAPPSSTDRVDDLAAAAPPDAATLAALPPPGSGAPVDAPPPQAGTLAAAPGTPGLPGHCPQCGTPTQPGQEICIVCGNRLERAYERTRGSRLPIVLAVFGLLLIGAAATFGAVELLSDDESSKKEATASKKPVPLTGASGASGPPGPVIPTGPSGATGPSGTTGPAEPTIPPATRESPPSSGGTPDVPSSSGGADVASWPSGKTAYTVVLQSATSRSAADAKAKQAARRGLPAGVLRSSEYSTLRAGYWVVFAGQFDSSEAATKAADRYAEQGFGGGYPRQVKPK